MLTRLAHLTVRHRWPTIGVWVVLTGWEPTTSLAEGMARTYRWIYDEMAEASEASVWAREAVTTA